MTDVEPCPEYVVLEDDPHLYRCEREVGHEPPHRVVIEWPEPTADRDH